MIVGRLHFLSGMEYTPPLTEQTRANRAVRGQNTRMTSKARKPLLLS